MKYDLNQYAELQPFSGTRLVIYPSRDIAVSLVASSSTEKIIRVSDCIDRTSAILPMPHELFQILDSIIDHKGDRVIVIGLEAYISLLADEQEANCISILLRRLDSDKLDVTYLLHATHDYSAFKNPKYRDSRRLIEMSGCLEEYQRPSVHVYPEKWMKEPDAPHSFAALLARMDDYSPASTEDYKMLCPEASAQAGLGTNVIYISSVKDFALLAYSFQADLPMQVLESLIETCVAQKQTPLEYLRHSFGQSNLETRLAPKHLVDISNNPFWHAYCWMLRKTLPQNSYLLQVIAFCQSPQDFLRDYTVNSAVSMLESASAVTYADERREGLKSIGDVANAQICDFITAIKDLSNADCLPWLNVGTDAESEEIIRRASATDLTYGLPAIFAQRLPALADYLSIEYDYGDLAINDYFIQYRKLKVADYITKGFVDLARNAVVPDIIQPRYSLLNDYTSDKKTALLVVDAMGVEYLPMLLSIANRAGMHILFHTVVEAKLPTSTTSYNDISWDSGRLDNIKELDNIVHKGAEANEKNTFKRNMWAALKVFQRVRDAVSIALSDYERVIVTADHGSSRLAVLAHQNDYTETIPVSGDILDWRFMKANRDVQRPDRLEATMDGYWVVRGYDRLPKPGGKLYELHGGATLEERLVPFVVFSSTPVTAPTVKSKPQQIEEEYDYDI